MSEFIPDMETARYACPECEEATTLWRGVTLEGWQSLVAVDHHDGQPVVHEMAHPGRDECGVDWDTAEPDGVVGCSCSWEGTLADLTLKVDPKLGIDGQPLLAPIPGQITIDDAA